MMRLLLLLVPCVVCHAFLPLAGQQQRHHDVAAARTFLSSSKDNDKMDDDKKEPDTGSHEELMYTLGVNLARQLGDIRPLVDNSEELTFVAKGLLDTVIGKLSERDQAQLLQARGQELNTLIATRANSIRQRLEDTGREMLQQMTDTDGTTQLPSGVVVHVLENANPDGMRPTRASTVQVHYHGTLPDGTVFDSTLVPTKEEPEPQPVTFPLGGVIPGWRDGLLHMHEGETAMVGIPPEQAYGTEGTPDGRIPGGSTLFFKITLLKILTAGVGGTPTLLGADGTELKKETSSSSGLLGADGKPL